MPQRAQRGHSKVPPQLRKWLEKWFCAHKIPKKVPRTIFLGPGAGKHAFEPLGQGKWVRETFMEFLCAQKKPGGRPGPAGSQNRRNKALARGELLSGVSNVLGMC